MLIDSHCHLTSAGLYERVDDVLHRAAEAGVLECITIATGLDDAKRALELSDSKPNVHVVAGIHPHEAEKVGKRWDEELKTVVAQPDVYALGEMGLDYHYDFSDRASQAAVFRRQLEIATDVRKPVVIHCREAHDDVMRTLHEFPLLVNVVFHCFTGARREAEEILAAGYWLSLTGVVTFKKSAKLREVAKMLPADRIMVETDSPYLSPEPVRSMRPNEPANVVHTAACIARERGISIEEFAALATANTRRFFSLPCDVARRRP
ncbi:MAG TPA: TatD family hydrolase [Phycisphaerae bacterium]|nr:TatD family hydrolase [Phycisphaerae bacterium]